MSMQGCSSLVASQTGKMADNIAAAIYNSDDLESVAQAVPTFLLLVDGMIESAPENPNLLGTGAQLYDAYAGAFVDDPARKSRLSDKSIAYARQAICHHDRAFCGLQAMGHEAFADAVAQLGERDLSHAYTLAVSWLNWIRHHSDDWNAVAQLPRPELILHRILEVDERYRDGMVHLYAGALSTLLPPALGGRPEQGRAHFERAIDISGGRNLMAHVVYAESYARLVFDQPLHHRLLSEVLAAESHAPGYVLFNTLAQREARRLLADEAAYF